MRAGDDLEGYIKCDPPNKHIDVFNGTFQPKSGAAAPTPLGPKNVILRGCQVRNTAWVEGVVIYTGTDSKMMQNASKPAPKLSTMTKTGMQQLIFIFGMQIIYCFVGALLCIAAYSQESSRSMWYIWNTGQLPPHTQTFALRFFGFNLLFSGFVPISLLVSMDSQFLEWNVCDTKCTCFLYKRVTKRTLINTFVPSVCKYCQSTFVQSDIEMYSKRLDRKCQVRNSELNEELGNVDYIFSDKTGTLTANVMVFRKCCIGGVRYGKGTTQVQRNIAMIRGENVPKDEKMEKVVPNVNFVDHRLSEVLAGRADSVNRKLSSLNP